MREGEVFGLLGPNGAGKSTTVRVLATLTNPDAGRAVVAGTTSVRDPGPCAARSATSRSVGRRPGGDGPREPRRSRARSRACAAARAATRVDELLALSAHDAADRVVEHGYSGGMKRRLDVALGLVHRPSVLFLDEPTTGLDPEARVAMWEELERLAERERLTILLTTHYLEEADMLATRSRS